MTITRPMSMDEFADHEGTAKRERAEFLSWRDEGEDGDGKIQVWIVDQPWVQWRHSFYRVARYENRDGEQVERIAPFYWNSMEEDSGEVPDKTLKLIRRQGYYLDSRRDEDDRVVADVDPFLKMLEWIRGQILAEKIDWLDPVFEFDAADSDAVKIRAGALLGVYPAKLDDLEDERERERFKKLKINLRESYKESSRVRLQYGFVVVKNDAPEDGVRIALESETIGTLVKRIYKDRKVAFKGDSQKADLIRKVCLQWEYDKRKSFSDMYHVVALTEEKTSDEVLAVFARYDEDPPDLERLRGQSNVAELERAFRDHWVHAEQPPWDELFAAAYERVKGTPAASLPEDFEHGANARASEKATSDTKATDVAAKKTTEIAVEKKTAAPDGPMVECEVCRKDMPDTALVCPHCNARYAECGGFVDLENVACKACGKDRPFKDLVCPHCKREYVATDAGIELKPEAPKSDEPRASRRRVK